MKNQKDESAYNNEVAASPWRGSNAFMLGHEYEPHFPAGRYIGIAAGDHLACIEYDEDWYAVIHLTSRTVLVRTFSQLIAETMLLELDRPGVNWNVTDLASADAESARTAIWLMKRVIKTGGYNITYQVFSNPGDR